LLTKLVVHCFDGSEANDINRLLQTAVKFVNCRKTMK